MSWIKAGLLTVYLTGLFPSLADDLFLTPQSATRLTGQRLELNCRVNKERDCKYTQFFWRHRDIHQKSSEDAERDIRSKGRFSISTESLSSSLVITDLKVTDAGYFNCSVMCVTIKMEFIWKSSQLEVRAVPKLDLHYQTSSENPSILHVICSAVGFYPPNITLSWDHSQHEVTHPILPDIPTLLQDGTYNISSILHVKNSLWSLQEEIGCVVNHSSLTQPLRKIIIQEAVPKLDLHYQTSSENPNILLLTCSAVGFYPPNITLSWDHYLHEVNHSILPDVPTLLQDGTYNISSILHVKTSLWSPGEEIGCVVNHSSLTRPLRKIITREVGVNTHVTEVSETRHWHWYLLFPITVPFLICTCLLVKILRALHERELPLH